MSEAIERQEDALYQRATAILDAARAHVSRAVDTTMVLAYWLVGRDIVEVQQAGQARAEYGEGLVKRLAARLQEHYGRGFSYSSVKRRCQITRA
ncbi:MAG TPA: DUF1016 family protein [Polyangiaceae bacterium]|nr:DUF1016 family protein [Polyangiaceae bacterium]